MGILEVALRNDVALEASKTRGPIDNARPCIAPALKFALTTAVTAAPVKVLGVKVVVLLPVASLCCRATRTE